MSTKSKFSVFNDEDDDGNTVTNSRNKDQNKNKAKEAFPVQRGVTASVNHQTDDSPVEPWRERSVQRVEKTVHNSLLYNLSPDAALVVQGRLQVSWITCPTKPDILSITGGAESQKLEQFDHIKLQRMINDIDREHMTFICDLSAITQGAQSVGKEKVTVLRANAYLLMPIVIGDRDVHSAIMIQRDNEPISNYFKNYLLTCNSPQIAEPTFTRQFCDKAWISDTKMVDELENAIRRSRANHIVVFMRDADTTSTSSTSYTMQTVMSNTLRIIQVLNTLSTTNKCVEIWMWSENCARAEQIKAHVKKEKLNVTVKSLELFRTQILFTSVGKPVENFVRSPKVLKTSVHMRLHHNGNDSDAESMSDRSCSISITSNNSNTSNNRTRYSRVVGKASDDDSSVDCKTSCSEDERSTAASAFVSAKASKALPDNRALMLQMATCPLTKALVQDPVLAPCGHHFERSSIEQRLESKSHCPICYVSLHKSQLYPCAALKAIAALLEMEV